MEKTYSSTELQPFEYFPQSDGTSLVVLRDNIERTSMPNDDGSSYDSWEADQVTVVTDMAEDDIADNFESLWALGEEQEYKRARAEMGSAEWREDIDAALLDIMEVMA